MIKPVNITTNGVASDLESIAELNFTSASELYFDINSIKTFARNAGSDFVEILPTAFDTYRQEESLRNKDVEFKQEYNIDVKSKDNNYPFIDMKCEIEFDENDTLAYLLIKQGSRLKYYDGLYNDFLNYITEQKIRSNIMIYIFDVDYEKSIQEFVDVIKKIKNITFKEDKKILVSKAIDKISSIEAEVHMIIEENNDIAAEDNQGRVDYSNRGFLLGCTKGEELFEFIKPQEGKCGRTCRGDIIEVKSVDLDVKPTFTVEDNIEVQDGHDIIKYLSKKSGYLIKEENQYNVSNSIDVDEISFKTTGTINTDLNSDISINVTKHNPLEDAIEEGMTVKVQNLSITGSLGAHTKIDVRDISLSGQSHKDSLIQCVNAKIRLHKGKIVGRKVEVETLEGGEIIADTVIVKNAMSGRIRAKTIEISMLGSHVTMEASEYIQVDRIRGEENRFIFDYSIDSELDVGKKDEEEYLKKLKDELDVLVSTLRESTVKVKKNLDPCKTIEAAAINSKNKGVEISSDTIKKLKFCRVMKVNYKNLREDIEHKKSQYIKLEKKLSSNKSSILDAKLVLNESLKGYNHIQYKLNDSKVAIELHTNESMKKKMFKLIEDEDGIFKIVNISESAS